MDNPTDPQTSDIDTLIKQKIAEVQSAADGQAEIDAKTISTLQAELASARETLSRAAQNGHAPSQDWIRAHP